MPYKELTAYNTSEGPQVLLVAANEAAPMLTPLILLGFFLIVALGTYNSQRRFDAKGDFAASFAVAGYVTLGVAFVMSLIPGLVNTNVLVVLLAISIIGTIWLYFSK